MQRIEKITLKNFKFFYSEVPIEVAGKNILLYGENGSGKSCIYWAIYTFLQSILKTKNAQISKYFDADKPENLINHFALAEESFIKVQFRADDGTLTEKTISKDVINTKSDTLVKEASYAGDLMNYKLLSRMHNFRNNQEIDWFPLFESEVLPFINFREPFVHYNGTPGNNNAADWWTFLKKNKPDKYYKNSEEYKSFQRSIQKFNSELKFFLNTITETANEILNDQFK
ncbi:MAG: AAA family ATPase, partial [Candidatus Marinimicrobia bacterium]|nr:AAA family ATPase [Candidatus Neomarinimicrobiota bacterium]